MSRLKNRHVNGEGESQEAATLFFSPTLRPANWTDETHKEDVDPGSSARRSVWAEKAINRRSHPTFISMSNASVCKIQPISGKV